MTIRAGASVQGYPNLGIADGAQRRLCYCRSPSESTTQPPSAVAVHCSPTLRRAHRTLYRGLTGLCKHGLTRARTGGLRWASRCVRGQRLARFSCFRRQRSGYEPGQDAEPAEGTSSRTSGSTHRQETAPSVLSLFFQ